ncbi:MAG: glycine--tRNA ligase subunit beta, partial [Alphaproteobacteria bacterium]
KIDTLVGFFAIGEKPTGSKDPYALRRAALGAIRLIVENGLRVPLIEVFWAAFRPVSDALVEKKGKLLQFDIGNLLRFFADRLKVHLREKGVRHDLISAVFAARPDDDLVRLLARVDALQKFLESHDGEHLLVAYRRAANIVRIEQRKDKRSYNGESVNPELLCEADEKAVAATLSEVSERSNVALADERFGEAMAALATLRQPVDSFFDNVTVNCDDAALRENRLQLLSRIQWTMDHVADFSKIEG